MCDGSSKVRYRYLSTSANQNDSVLSKYSMFETAVAGQCMEQPDEDRGRLTVVDAGDTGIGTVDSQVLNDM
jgi:hypothetical protein